MIDIAGACDDPRLFAPWFREAATWRTWHAFLAAAFALPMADEQLALFRRHTGREQPPATPVREAWLVCGRRAGKSFVLALIAVFLACFRDYRQHLAPGERGTVLVLAADRRQARIIFRYVGAFLRHVPMLARMVERETADTFDLDNAVSIEVATASHRTTRGYAIVAALCDEVAHWHSDEHAASPDRAILDAIRPGMATIPGAMLLCASSPYARRGALWEAFRRHYRPDGDPAVLVWRATTREMNPTVDQRIIDEAMKRDPASAAAEYMAEFRGDVEGYVEREAVEAIVALGVRERPPVPGVRYVGFLDPSGGRHDSYTCAIAHREDGAAVLDVLREARPPFSPASVSAEFAALLRQYGIAKAQGDRFAGEWPREALRADGVGYEASAKPKSDLYAELLPMVNSGSALLLDNPRLVHQLATLERRTARGGRDSIDHAPGAHDDLANAAAGALVAAARPLVDAFTYICTGYGGSGAIVLLNQPKQRSWVRRYVTPEQFRERAS